MERLTHVIDVCVGIIGGLAAIDFVKAAGDVLLSHYAKAWALVGGTVSFYAVLVGAILLATAVVRRGSRGSSAFHRLVERFIADD